MKTTLIVLAARDARVGRRAGADLSSRPAAALGAKRRPLDDRAASVDEREARINARIQRGMSDGRINEHEARRLYRELRDVEAKERAFKNDGRLSRRETDELNRDLDRVTGHVREQIRD
jgi:hypothetical protein